MTRISENQSQRILVANTLDNRTRVDRFAQELSSGYKVTLPGDSNQAGTISRFRQALDKIASYTTTITTTKSVIQYQDDVMNQMSDLIIRAKEIGSQGANETNSATSRVALAEEIYQLRDHVVSLANSQYQGRYVYGGADDDDPPYDQTTYTLPATATEAQERWVFDGELGTSVPRSVQITDDLNIRVNTPGNQLFDTTIQALERMGRAMSGYTTTPASGAPDGGGVAYVFPTDFAQQTADIRATIDLLDTAREQQILPERVSLGGRLRRLETGESLLELTKTTAEEVLARLQNTDETESAAGMAQAQTALEASYNVTARVLRLSIMDYI